MLQFHSRIWDTVSPVFLFVSLLFYSPRVFSVDVTQRPTAQRFWWLVRSILLVYSLISKRGKVERRKETGSSLIGNLPERNPVDHGYIWPNVAVRVNERAKGWRRWRGVSPRSPLHLFPAKIRLHLDTFHPHLVSLSTRADLGYRCQRVCRPLHALPDLFIFRRNFYGWSKKYFLIKVSFFLKIYICFQVFSKSVRSSRGLFNLENSIYMYIFFYLIFDLMKVRRKFTNFIFMQDIRQINSKVNDFRMRFFSVPNFPSE